MTTGKHHYLPFNIHRDQQLAINRPKSFQGLVLNTESGKHVHVKYTPSYPTFIQQNWVLLKGIPIFIIFDPKQRLWVLIRTASAYEYVYPQSMF